MLKDNLTQAQQRIKYFADQHRTKRTFKEGDHVYLRLHPYRQTSISMRKNMKLDPKYYGPYTIIQKVGNVAYKLLLPPSIQIHPVPHASLLKKKKIGRHHTTSTHLPTIDNEVSNPLSQPLILGNKNPLKEWGAMSEPVGFAIKLQCHFENHPRHVKTDAKGAVPISSIKTSSNSSCSTHSVISPVEYEPIKN
ncbi:hypothetical protein BUALT_Bualt10G0004900 [Buddleja alternifolia]|uniref:Tf2-1-like SH3-like domain-containing protein n=1 Tax=Buddleja alternifolia TaxID=168488 RepID=A0AAV6WV02_9LAMI|nr:hypothetical protein BUALT_Bualt10G0004900 [Buddleja alternifolia]